MRNLTLIILAIATFILPIFSIAQEQENFSNAIEDNSFLIEEAYNQEAGVVQHISNGLYYSSPEKDFHYILTQEWPMWGQQHQLSYSIPYSTLNSGSSSGIGDIMVNYRYQLTGKESWAAVSPRLSMILPTGDEVRGLGDGSFGVQINLPVSRRAAESVIFHANVGWTLLPDFEMPTTTSIGQERKLLTVQTLGGSVIWLVEPERFNVMLEVMLEVIDPFSVFDIDPFEPEEERLAENIFTINPGLRYAIDVGNLQVVPGLSVPMSFSDRTSLSTGMFFYLSFEHPFSSESK